MIYFFSKHYLFPKKSKTFKSQTARSQIEHEPDRFTESMRDMRTALHSLKETVEMMAEAVKQLNAKKYVAEPSAPAAATYDDSGIRAELQSIKSLLLSRNQFPAVPTTSPVLPSWQLGKSNSQVFLELL
jgi:hypothetical protein